MSSETDQFEAVLIDLLNQQEDGLDQVEKYGPELIRLAVHHYLGTIAIVPGVQDKIADILIARLRSAIAYGRKVIKIEKRMALELGSPDKLRAIAKHIEAGITTPADSLSKEVIKDALKAMDSDSWVSDASGSYSRGFDGQTAAVALVSTMGKGLEDALNSMADGLDSAFTALISAAASLLAIIVGLVVALATFETIVGAIVGIIVAIVGVVGLIANINQLNSSLGDTTGDALRDLQSKSQKWHEPTFATT